MAETFSLTTQSYQGPLDVLLDLVESRKLSISDVSLAEVTDAYLSYVESLPALPLAETSQFVVIASTLLLIKSRTLLPSLQLSDDEEETVHDLESRLARYAIIRNVARLLRISWGTNPLIVAQKSPEKIQIFSPGESNVSNLQLAIEKVLHSIPKKEKVLEASVKPVRALEDVVRHVHARVANAIRSRFSDLVRGGDKHDVIVHFLAVLELVRAGSLSVTQQHLFSDITMELEGLTTPRYG